MARRMASTVFIITSKPSTISANIGAYSRQETTLSRGWLSCSQRVDPGQDFIRCSGVTEETDDLGGERLGVSDHVPETGQVEVHPRKPEYVLRHRPVVDAAPSP